MVVGGGKDGVIEGGEVQKLYILTSQSSPPVTMRLSLTVGG